MDANNITNIGRSDPHPPNLGGSVGRSDPQPPRSAQGDACLSKNLGGLEVYRIGRLGKAHGIHGEVTFHFDDDVFDRTDADYIVLEVDGILVPFFIEEYRFRSDSTCLMKLEGVDSQERARELTNVDVYFPRHLAENDDDAPLTYAFLVGFTIVDAATGKKVGVIESVDESTMNILFCLEDGTLIPAAEELIEGIDQQKKEISLRLPEGILEL